MLFCIRQADTMQRKRGEKVKLSWRHKPWVWFPSVCTTTLWDREHTHAQTPKSLKSNPLYRRVTMVIIYRSTSQQHDAAEISCMSSWADPINSRQGRRGSWTRCFPNDKTYINKQHRKRYPPFLPVILLCLNNTVCNCDWACACVQVL